MGEKRNAYRLVERKLEGKRLLGRPRRRRVKMDLGEVGWGDVDWINLAQNSVLSLWVPYTAAKLSSGLTTGGLSISAQLHRVS
jgi:hypothetical protein